MSVFARKMAATAALALMLLAMPAAAAPVDPLRLYGEEILFDVYRKGEQVGQHSTRFRDTGAGIAVDSDFSLAVTFFGITFYRFAYSCQSLWTDGMLRRMTATVNDDGDNSAMEVVAEGDVLTIRTTAKVAAPESYSTPLPLYPTNHWNVGVLTQDRVLNTLTGRVNEVTITPMGREAVESAQGPIMATRYAYSGELEKTDVWYDDDGRWVKMRFAARDGSMVEYVCRSCQGTGS